MIVLRTAAELRAWRAAHDREAGRDPEAGPRPIAFVPTMGFLHQGHLSLMREGRRRVGDGGVVAISIFVNPTQFGPTEDLSRYPRDEAGDLEKSRGVGVDLAFCPADPRELFPADHRTWVDVDALGDHLCGRARPGHFRGVCTVVAKLWGLFRPSVGIFGEKDYQQLAILRRMHRDLGLGGDIVGMPIVREADGLAMSSRNANLGAEARAAALALPRYLAGVKARFDAGARSADALLGDPAAALAPGRIDYVSLVDAEELQPVTEVRRPVLCAAAVFFGGVRLIDNVVLRP